MGTLASQAEIGVRVQAPGTLLWVLGVAPLEKFGDCIRKILQYGAFLAGKWLTMPSIMRSNNENAVPIHSTSFSTMGMAFPRVPLKMTFARYWLPILLTVSCP